MEVPYRSNSSCLSELLNLLWVELAHGYTHRHTIDTDLHCLLGHESLSRLLLLMLQKLLLAHGGHRAGVVDYRDGRNQSNHCSNLATGAWHCPREFPLTLILQLMLMLLLEYLLLDRT